MDEVTKKAQELLEFLRNKGEHSLTINLKALSTVEMSAAQCMHECKKIGLEYHSGLENRIIQYRFTDATVDRHNEVIVPKGVKLADYKKDPIVLGQHAWSSNPIGKALQTKYYDEYEDVAGQVLFFDDEIDPSGISEDFFRMAKSGALQQGSIGFTAKYEDVRKPSPEEREKYGIDKHGFIFDKIVLLEFSLVSIPANPNARQIASRRKAFREKTLVHYKSLGMPIDGLRDEDKYIVREGMDFDEKKVKYIEDESELKTVELDTILEWQKAKVEPLIPRLKTMVFSPKEFKTDEDKLNWIKEHRPLNTENPPDEFEPKSFKMVNVAKGVQAIIGKLKKEAAPEITEPEGRGDINATIYIDASDDTETRQRKITEALEMKKQGITPDIKAYAPEPTVQQGPISKQTKTNIKNALKHIDSLKAIFESLLQSAGDGDTDDPEGDLKGLPEEETDFYTSVDKIVEQANLSLKNQ
jgi:hypothetical protein